jgi:hypothetical protein
MLAMGKTFKLILGERHCQRKHEFLTLSSVPFSMSSDALMKSMRFLHFYLMTRATIKSFGIL